MRQPTFILSVLLVVAAALFGGASRENPLRLAAVELSALPLAIAAARHLFLTQGLARRSWPALLLLAAVAFVPLAQLLPLPPIVWSHLPGQTARVEALRLAGLSQPWLPITLAPAATAACALALLPPVAMFLGGLCLNRGQQRRLMGVWIAVATAGLILGVAQMASPSGGPAYLYATTNLGSLVGLFANRNHEAAFLLALAPFAATVATAPSEMAGGWLKSTDVSRALGVFFLLISVVALGVIRSRAGVILAAPAVAGAMLVLLRGRGNRQNWRVATGVAIAAILATGAVVVFGLSPIIERFSPQPAEEVRFERWPYIADAARGFLPFGSGLGSFAGVFQAAEPLRLVGPTYFNHAHNEYLEVLLETGIAGAILFVLFGVWLSRATYRAWREGGVLPRAASLAIALLMAASVVDYPLRTETLSVLFAFSCGILARPAESRSGR